MPTRKGVRRQKAPKLTETAKRAKRATGVRARLLTYRVQHGLTWEELQAVMAKLQCELTLPTLKRYGLGYTTPYATTTATVEKFLRTVNALGKIGEDPLAAETPST
jgi:hypothetical protein